MCTDRSHIAPAAAGVADIDRAKAALQFAKRYELLDSEALRNIKLVELDYTDVSVLASIIPRRSRLIVVDGDVRTGGDQTDVSAGEKRP